MEDLITKRELTEALDNHYVKLNRGLRHQIAISNDRANTNAADRADANAAVCLGKMDLIETILKVLKDDSTAALQDLSGRERINLE